MDQQHCYAVFETAFGFCALAWSGAGVTRFQLPAASAQATERLLLRHVPHARAAEPSRAIAAVIAAVQGYFAGEARDFSTVSIDLGGQDAFRQRVYGMLRQVGWGQTTTYGTLAKQLGGGPEVARDVGQAMAGNPVALIIPCHRVMAAGGKPGGFSAPGGTGTKLRMLALEGARTTFSQPAQQSLGF